MAEDQGHSIIAANITVAVAATVAVGLRFLARRLQRATLRIDDHLILAALPFGWALCISTLVAVHYGLGKHEDAVDAESRIKEEQAYYASEILWALTIPIIKSSILMLFCRIFGCLRYFRKTACAIGSFSICWSVAIIVTLAFECRPIQAVWDKSIQGTCVSDSIFYVASSVPNTITDIAILLLPLKAVARLQTTRSQKMLLLFIFSLGSLTCIISLVRLVTLIKLPSSDQTWALGRVSIWTTAEPCLGIVSACLPTMRPLLRKLLGRKDSHTLSKGQARTPTFVERVSFKRNTNSFRKIGDDTTKPSETHHSVNSIDSGETYHEYKTSEVLLSPVKSERSSSWPDSELGLMLDDRNG